MNRERLAVIDLGSNTFHLLICEKEEENAWSVLYKERIYVKLGSAGLGRIDDHAISRGLDAMVRFKTQLLAYDVQYVRCIGTAALREAENGQIVADLFSQATGMQVDIIDGQKEATYILMGIRSCIPELNQPGLIMDIGGGSVEFILYQGDHILFKGSYKIGVAILFRLFHHHDPITQEEQSDLDQHLSRELSLLLDILRDTGPYYLIGSSGSFEVLNDVLPRIESDSHWSQLNMDGVLPYLVEIISTDIQARRQIPEIPIERLDYIVVAYALIRFVITRAMPDRLYFCDYALKEGVLSEMIGAT